MSINIYTSNRLEILALQCGEIFRQTPLPPLEKEIVVVQSRGMARWLAMEFSSQLSVWANGEFPFPNTFVSDILRLVVKAEEQPMYERSRATWQIMGLLAECADEPLFSSLSSYLADPLKRFQLSSRLADLFDQYIIYRPDFIAAWEKDGEGENWQAALWQRLARRFDQGHRGDLLAAFLETIKSPVTASLPSRVTVFGVSSLSPFHLEVFHALSKHVEVNLFFVNPCRNWWADIFSAREIAHRVAREDKEADELYLESGNPLLASMGHLARDFLVLLQEHHCIEYDFFESPEPHSLLSSIQRDILDLTDGTRADHDDSIAICSCHGPIREVEVLQDHLLRLFDNDPSLSARDVIVMSPDIEPYSPLVSAVFGLDRTHPHFIPYTFADRSMGAESEFIDAFFALLDLGGSRFQAHAVLDVVKTPVFCRKFSLSEADCQIIEQWVDDVAIRWGKDGMAKQDFDLPVHGENTWQAGLDRLLLGYAMQGEESLFASILPYSEIEVGDTEVLGRLLECVTVLFQGLEMLQQARSLDQWGLVLQQLADSCLLADQADERDAQVLRDALRDLEEYHSQAEFSEKVSLQVIYSWLDRALRQEKSPHGFLSGGVTFCSLLPMRAIPFKVVCLLGMDDGVFPRPSFPVSFDLMSQDPRPGDRSPRHDDRYLFLEAILSAREQLYISYTGQSMRDDTTLPPSVLVSELLDYMTKVTGESEALVTRHRLQPFHPDYFMQSSVPMSYSRGNCQAASQLIQGSDPDAGFWHLPLMEPVNMEQEIALDAFIDFFIHPVRFFCENRLGIRLSAAGESANDTEPFWLDGLNRYQLESDIVESFLHHDDTSLFSHAKAKGMLPHGRAGETAFSQVEEELAGFCQQLQEQKAPDRDELIVSVKVNDFVISGRLTGVTDDGLLYARPAKLKGKDLLRAWIRHLMLDQVDDVPKRTVLVAKDQLVSFDKVTKSKEELEKLVSLYLLGLRKPLQFFPETSYVFANNVYEGNIGKAWKAARVSWQGNWNWSGECDDEYLKFRYRGSDPLDDIFAQLALDVFTPIFDHHEK